MEIKSILATRRPDGIFASDDLTAILIMKVASQLGIAIPDDLKLIGYDGTAFIEHYFPQLTTIKQPIKEIASLTIEVLLKKIGNEKPARTMSYRSPCFPEAVSKSNSSSSVISGFPLASPLLEAKVKTKARGGKP
ncbi:substrate-binding domain-containing protein [Streptococcus equi]|uniref:substrate-binding domain-containing protein n=1 Tax=Streptococcus equi TaxID=1336 RepID=UPI0039C66810